MTAPPTTRPPGLPPRPTAPSAPPRGSMLPGLGHQPAPKFAKLDGKFTPPALILNAVEGWGKTTCGAYADSPGIIMAPGETGYRTLLGKGLVPSVPALSVTDWAGLLAIVDALIEDDQGIHTLVLDAIGGLERLCHEHVCLTQFDGEWGERGFGSYQKGYDLSVGEWLKLLSRLDRLRAVRGSTVLMLSHCKVKTFKNPLGADYDRYASDVHDKTWGVTAKWADAVLFGTFVSVVETNKTGKAESLRKGKGIGGTDRVVYTERRDGYDAKNRYGMPESIDIPSDPAAAWQTVWAHIAPSA